MQFPQWRTLALHAGSMVGGGVAVLAWASSKSIDLYAIVDQVNVVVADVTKLIAIFTPFCTAGYAVWRASTKNKIEDASKDPDAVKIALKITPTPQINAMADALKQEPR
jgi:hypothetical protein